MPNSNQGPSGPTEAAFIWGIREQESGGDYKAGNSIGATGAYQILASNIPSWSKEALGKTISVDEFLKSPGYQDAIADFKLGNYYKAYGPRGAASAWYSGDPKLSESTRSQSGGPSIKDYVDSVINHASQAPSGITLPLSGSKVDTKPGSSSSGGTTNATQAGLLSFPGDIIKFFENATDAVEKSISFFTLLFNPTTYIRLGAGFAGLFMLTLAFVFLYKESK